MPATIVVNMKTVIHASSVGIATFFPDACKTPTPGGPVPMPYPNIAMSKDTTSGSTTVKCDGNPINLKSSKFMMSQGDEAGVAMGVLSNKIKGSADWLLYSMDVKANGKNVCRLMDLMRSNGGGNDNTPPAPCMQPPMGGGAGGGGDGSGGGGGKAKRGGKKGKGNKGRQNKKKKKTKKKKACKDLNKKKMSKADAQKQSGQLPEHFDSNCKTCQDNNVAASFRDTNPACADHIKAGMQSKPMDIKDKTAKAGEFAGTVVGGDGKQILKNGSPVTGDYDLHDMIDMGSGKSIAGGSAQEAGMLDKFNQGMKAGGPPGSTNPMVNHGPWTEWDKVKAGKANKTSLPAVAIVPNKKTGKPDFYRLENEKDWKNFRRCKGK